MRYSIVLVGTLALVAACSRDKGAETGSTTVTGAPQGEAKPVTVEEVRTVILERNPAGSEALSNVVVAADNGVVTLRGTVPDEATHADMVNRVKRMPNVKTVRDEMTVAPKGGTMQGGTMQGGTMQGGTMQGTQGTQGTQGGTMQGGTMQGTQGTQQGTQGTQGTEGTQGMQPGTTGTTHQQGAQPMEKPSKGTMEQQTQGSTKTKRTDAVRAGLTKDKAAPPAVLQGLTIRDDGKTIILSGDVPDDATHDAILKSAKKAAGKEQVQDNLHVSGK